MSDVPPTIRDYPDFMIPDGAASAAIYDQGVAVTGLFQIGNFDVSSWPTLSMRFDFSASAAGPFIITVNWFSAINGGRGIPIAQRNFSVEAGDSVFCSWPNFGSSVNVVVTPLGAAVPWSGGLNLTCRADALHNVPARDYRNEFAGVVAAGGVALSNLPLVVNGGWANFYYANSNLGATAHEIQYLTDTGLWFGLAHFELPANGGSAMVWLPQRKLRVAVVNRAGAPQNIVTNLVLA